MPAIRHGEVIKYIKDFELYNDRLPTRKEICYDIKIGLGTLQRIIFRLEKKGNLKRLPRGTLEFRIMK